MPKFKTERIFITDNDRNKLFDFKIDVLIDSDGVFYCNMPEAEARRLEEAGVKMAYNSYKEADWNLFEIPSVETPPHIFDGHTSQDVLKRMYGYLSLSKQPI